jgi:hypothetical protein
MPTCTVVTNVQRPCRMTLSTESIDVRRAVKGLAIDASPSFTIVGSCSCSCNSREALATRSLAEAPFGFLAPLLAPGKHSAHSGFHYSYGNRAAAAKPFQQQSR